MANTASCRDSMRRSHPMNDAKTSPAPKSVLAIPKLLVGQKALVTGANSGIGEAVAIALGQAGADVAVNYVTATERAEEVAATIRGHGVKAMTHKADVSQESEVRDMFRNVIAELG